MGNKLQNLYCNMIMAKEIYTYIEQLRVGSTRYILNLDLKRLYKH